MSLFKRAVPTLQELHADAENLGARALSVFHSVADDLRVAANQHADVADAAQAQIDQLATLRDAADQASSDKLRQADAIAKLVG